MHPIRPARLLLLSILLSVAVCTDLIAQSLTILQETFDAAVPPNLPSGWSTGGLGTWATDTVAPSSGSGVNNLMHGGANPGYVDTPEFDLSAVGSGTISYLARRSGTYETSALAVRASIDGGSSYPILLIPSGSALPASDGQYEVVSAPIPPELFGATRVVLRFETTGGGSSAARLRIDDVIVSGTPATLAVSPGRLVFSAGAGATQSNTVQVTNRTADPLTVQPPALSGSAFSIAPTDAVTLDPGEGRTYTVTFAPSATDAFHGTAAYQHDLGTTTVLLTGLAGTNPFGFTHASSSAEEGTERIDVPLALSYVNATPLQGLEFTAEWDADSLRLVDIVRGSAISDTGAWSLDREVQDGRVRVVLLGSGTNALAASTYDPLMVLRFDASSVNAGLHPSLNVTLHSLVSALAVPAGDDAGVSVGTSVHTLTLIGQRAYFSPSAASLDFGIVEAGESEAGTIMVTNENGSRDLVVSNVNATNSLFAVTPTSATVPPGGAQEFAVTFSPTLFAFGQQSGSLIFTHDGEGGEATIALSGFGRNGQGDPTGDGMVEAMDLVYVIDYILQRLSPTAQQRSLADVYPFGTGDGRLDVHDATVLSNAIVRGQWPDGQSLPLEITPDGGGAGKAASAIDAQVTVYPVQENGTASLYLSHAQPLRAFQLTLDGVHNMTAVDVRNGSVLLQEHADREATRVLVFRNDGRYLAPGNYPIAVMSGPALSTTLTYSYVTAIDSVRVRLPVDVQGLIRTGTEEHPDSPGTLTLDPPYPNPFRRSTEGVLHVPVAVPEPGPITLSVFDVLGRRVQTILDGELAPGRFDVTWDGIDARGIPVTPGLYLLRLETGEAVRVKRVMVLP